MAWKQTSQKISGLTGNSELTQEQLAEVLGVSVGAVYKCESRSSLPELRLIMEMADFFDISVDALLPHSSEITDRFHSYIPSARERFHRPLSRLAVDRALAYLDESAKRMADSEAVLLHGDANATNCLEDPQHPDSFRFIDPNSAIGEKAYDLGMAMIIAQDGFVDCPLEIGTARCRRLHERTGVDAAVIWQWGVIQCVSTPLVYLGIDHPAAKALARIADAWAAAEPFK